MPRAPRGAPLPETALAEFLLTGIFLFIIVGVLLTYAAMYWIRLEVMR